MSINQPHKLFQNPLYLLPGNNYILRLLLINKHELNNCIYQDYKKLKAWKGFRLCAIDGSSVRLPNEADITDHLGLKKGRPEQADCPMGMASVFYDALYRFSGH